LQKAQAESVRICYTVVMNDDRVSADIDIAARLKARRKGARLTQKVLADRLGWARPTISALEAGKQSMRACDLGAYAKALGCSPLRLLPVGWRK